MKKHQELIDAFGKRIANALYRYYGICTINELREYCIKYPYDTMSSYKAICWRGVGDKGYEEIENYFKRNGISFN